NSTAVLLFTIASMASRDTSRRNRGIFMEAERFEYDRVGRLYDIAAFDKIAGICAILAALASILYTASLVIVFSDGVASLFQLCAGLLATIALLATYRHFEYTHPSAARAGFLFAIAGSFGTA